MKRTLYLFLVALFAMTLSCGEGEDNKSDNSGDDNESVTDDKQSDEPAPGTKTFYVYEKADIDESKLPELTGDIFLSKMWNDENGLNYLVFTRVEERSQGTDGPDAVSKELHAYHFKKSGTAMVLVREIKDFVHNCIFDNTLELIENSLNITDVDNNNYAEVTFMYKLGCRSDITPLEMKLMHLENGDKYAIRGNERVQVGPEHYEGGEAKADGTFKKVPERQKFAYQVWTDNGGEKPYTKAPKTLLNADFLAGTWVLSGKYPETKDLPPVQLKFTKDGKLSYTIMEEDWVHTEWDMKKYPNVISDLPGQLSVEEGDLYYKTEDPSGKQVYLLYNKL